MKILTARAPLRTAAIALVALAVFSGSAGTASVQAEEKPPPRVSANAVFIAPDYTGKRVGFVPNTIYEDIVRADLPLAVPVPFTTTQEILQALAEEHIDAALVPETSATLRRNTQGDIRILKPRLSNFSYGYIVNKQNQELRASLNAYLAKIKRDGTYDDMIRRWLETDGPAVMPDIETEGPGGTLVFATAGNVDVFSFGRNDRAAGFDVEFAKRYARSVGKKLTIVHMNFQDLIPAVVTGAADFAGNVLVISPERERLVDFTNPYFQNGAVICQRDGGEKPAPPRTYSPRDFEGKTLAVVADSNDDLVITLHLPPAFVLSLPGIDECVRAVKSGKADALVAEDSVIRRIVNRDPELVRLQPLLTTQLYCMVVADNNHNRLSELNSFLNLIRLDNSYDDMIGRWVESPLLHPMPVIPPADNHRNVTFVTTGLSPLGVGNDGSFELEFAQRFARHIGARLEVIRAKTAAEVVDALLSGRADFAADPSNLNAIQKERLAFTEPYYSGGAGLCIRNNAGLGDAGRKRTSRIPSHIPLADLLAAAIGALLLAAAVLACRASIKRRQRRDNKTNGENEHAEVDWNGNNKARKKNRS